jgi:hypothetical protein
MLHRFGTALAAIALTAGGLQPLTCAAQARLSPEHGGLGLRQQAAPGAESPSGSELKLPVLQTEQASDWSLFGGTREPARRGPGAAEAYGGVAYSFSRGWGSSLEAAYAAESPLAPRQYALAGEVRTALGNGKALSVGIRYRVYDPGPGAPGEAAPGSGYALVASRSPATAYAPGYQLRFGYQASEATLLGFALGREMETYAPALDPASSYPLQVSFTGQHWLTPSWALSYDVVSGDLGGPSPLRIQGLGLRLGVRYRF